MQSSDITESECSWVEKFSIASLIKGTIQEQNDLGLVVNFDNINNVLGFIPQYLLGGATLEHGSVVQAVVLDISRAERLNDLSSRRELINSSTKEKRKRGIFKELEIHQWVSNVFTSTGSSVVASVEALQSPLTSERLLLPLEFVSGILRHPILRGQRRNPIAKLVLLSMPRLLKIKPFKVRVNFGQRFRGKIHITEVNDVCTSEDPFAKFRVGQSVSARVVAKPCHTDIKKSQLWELLVKPAILREVIQEN